MEGVDSDIFNLHDRLTFILISTSRACQFIAMRVSLNEITKGIFTINHSIGFFTGIVFPDRHSLFPAVRNDFSGQGFNIRVLDTEMENLGLPVFKIVFPLLFIFELKNFNTDLITG